MGFPWSNWPLDVGQVGFPRFSKVKRRKPWLRQRNDNNKQQRRRRRRRRRRPTYYTASYTYTKQEDGEVAYVAAHAHGIIVRGDGAAVRPGGLQRIFRVLYIPKLD